MSEQAEKEAQQGELEKWQKRQKRKITWHVLQEPAKGNEKKIAKGKLAV